MKGRRSEEGEGHGAAEVVREDEPLSTAGQKQYRDLKLASMARGAPRPQFVEPSGGKKKVGVLSSYLLAK